MPDDDFTQMPMFEPPASEEASAGPSMPAPALNRYSSLDEAIVVYLEALQNRGASHYTVAAFRSDLGLLAGWAGPGRAISALGTAELNRFLSWMLEDRGVPCSPKTYQRRVTALKHFFAFLRAEEALDRDPALALIHKAARGALPEVLNGAEVERLLAATQRLADDPRQPDARPNLLVLLLLETGMKKGEIMNLALTDIQREDLDGPRLWIRYEKASMRHKERHVPLSSTLMRALDAYLLRYKPRHRLFECTARNLEYVLRDLAALAGLPPRKLSFESLRWTAAVRDFASGMEEEALRLKLGLSRVSWRDTIHRLAELRGRMGG